MDSQLEGICVVFYLIAETWVVGIMGAEDRGDEVRTGQGFGIFQALEFD
jgi:hypothetical protein